MAHPRKRVYAIRRGADGSAFQKWDEFLKDFEVGNKVEIHRKGYEKWTNMTKEERQPFVLVAEKLNSDYVKLLLKEESEIQVVDDEADSAEVGKYDLNYMDREMYYDSDSSGGSGLIPSETCWSFDSEDLFQARPWLTQPEN